MKQRSLNLIQLNIAVLIWSGTAMFGKGVKLPAEQITCARSLVAAIALLAFLGATRSPVRVRKPSHYGVMGILGLFLCLHWVTYFAALKVSSAAVAILALHTHPVLTTIVEPFVFKEKLRKVDLIVAALVFGGVAIMTPELSLSNDTTRGIAFGVVSGVLFMVRNLLARKYVQQYPSSTLMFWQTMVAGILLLPVLFTTSSAAYTHETIGLLLLLGVAFTALPHTLYAASFKTLSAKTVGILSTMLPFYAAVAGYFIHNETITSRTAIGGAVILACILYETTRSMKAE